MSKTSVLKHVENSDIFDSDAEIDNLILDVEAYLKSCKKIPVRLPFKDSNDNVVEVGYNGFMMLIKCGESVEVPEPIFEILKNSGRFF